MYVYKNQTNENPELRTSCNKRDFPPGYENISEKCKKHWNDAEDFVENVNVGVNKLSEQSAILVEKKRPLRSKEVVCYNPKFFKEKGWCNVQGSTEKDPKWGFCSPSCEYLTTPVSLE